MLPRALRPDSDVAIVHAAGPSRAEDVARGQALLAAHGVKTRRACAPEECESPAYLAGTDRWRAAQLRDALEGADVVWCARGGYGTMRVLEALDGMDAPWPWLVGYSDITALHLACAARGGRSLHGPMIASLGKHDTPGDSTLAYALQALRGDPAPLQAKASGDVGALRGPLLGGNLSLVEALYRTRWLPSLRGALLCIEDVGEPLYRIDRMLEALRLRGASSEVAGVVLGQFTAITTRAGETLNPEESQARVVELLRRWSVPLLTDAPFGHAAPNHAWVHGGVYRFDAAESALVWDEPPLLRGVPPLLRPRREHPNAIVERALRDGIGSGAQVVARERGREVLRIAAGSTARTPDADTHPVRHTTRFDIASVTKAVSTSVLAGVALERGWLTLDTRCPAELQAARPRLDDLLRHTSGLPAYERVWEQVREGELSDDARAEAARERFASIPASAPGAQAYSDVGYIALGRWLEAVLQEHAGVADLRGAFERFVSAPLGLERTSFSGAGEVAATEWCPWRGATLQGVVHDENAQALGGACGHAGLFSTADELARIGDALLGFGPPLLRPETVAHLWDRAHKVEGGTYVLGWDTPSGPRSNAGARMTREATVGHLGFTGTSLWIDRAQQRVIVLLTNRVHPSRDRAGIRWLRPTLHDAVVASMGSAD